MSWSSLWSCVSLDAEAGQIIGFAKPQFEMVACEAPTQHSTFSRGSNPIGLSSACHDTRLYREFIDSEHSC